MPLAFWNLLHLFLCLLIGNLLFAIPHVLKVMAQVEDVAVEGILVDFEHVTVLDDMFAVVIISFFAD
jgi:hypothetical protein